MNAPLSLPPKKDLDTLMLEVARDVAMDIYPLDTILSNHEITHQQFQKMERVPRFQNYLKEEQKAWAAAGNVAERAKLKAGIIVETFMTDAYGELANPKHALNHRVELLKTLAKIGGVGEGPAQGGQSGPAFQLQINIGQDNMVSINARPPRKPPESGYSGFVEHKPEDDYDPFTSPNTLED